MSGLKRVRGRGMLSAEFVGWVDPLWFTPVAPNPVSVADKPDSLLNGVTFMLVPKQWLEEFPEPAPAYAPGTVLLDASLDVWRVGHSDGFILLGGSGVARAAEFVIDRYGPLTVIHEPGVTRVVLPTTDAEIKAYRLAVSRAYANLPGGAVDIALEVLRDGTWRTGDPS